MNGLTRVSTLGAALAVLLAAVPGYGRAAAPPDLARAKEERARRDAVQLARQIDQALEQRLRSEKVTASPRADDAEFMRRVYLDLTGRIPPADQAAAFLDSQDAAKRAKLIEQLLASKEYGKYQADIWRGLLLPRTSDNRFFLRYYTHLERWLEESFNANKPWDRMARELLTASGPADKTGPVAYFLANPTADKVTDNVTRVLLGVQLQCAQCHNHPFTDWKQDEYWGMAAFFTRVRPEGNPRQAARAGGSISISEGRQLPGRRRLPESAKVLPPKFLQGERPAVKPDEPVRPILADWMTSPKNPYFARAIVNRTWGQLFGRGFVNPVDDMHEGNAASHPALLGHLAGQLVEHEFDLKFLLRAVCNSDAYQRSSKPAGNNGGAPAELFARMTVKVLTPGQLYDSLTQALGAPQAGGPGRARGGAAARFGPVTPRALFVNFFQPEDGADPTEYQAGIPQVLRLMNGPAFNNPGAVTRLTRDAKDWKAAAEKLYLATLSRRPTAAELERVGGYLARHRDDSRQALADVLWALINCSEFAVNH
jgi:hypothetical protein